MITKLSRLVSQPILYRGFAYFWLAITCYLLFKPGFGFQEAMLFSGEDKAAHLILFANLSLLWSINIRFDLQMNRSKTIAIVLSLGIIFAALSEWAQDFIPNRAMDMADFQFDMLGVLIGTAVFFFIEKKLKSRKIEL